MAAYYKPPPHRKLARDFVGILLLKLLDGLVNYLISCWCDDWFLSLSSSLHYSNSELSEQQQFELSQTFCYFLLWSSGSFDVEWVHNIVGISNCISYTCSWLLTLSCRRFRRGICVGFRWVRKLKMSKKSSLVTSLSSLVLTQQSWADSRRSFVASDVHSVSQ